MNDALNPTRPAAELPATNELREQPENRSPRDLEPEELQAVVGGSPTLPLPPPSSLTLRFRSLIRRRFRR